jgi:hypothetical protein
MREARTVVFISGEWWFVAARGLASRKLGEFVLTR